MLLWLAFGFTDPATPLPSGLPVEHHARHPALQWKLSAGAAARAFAATWGPASIRWNEATVTPRFVALSAVPEADADWLVADLAALASVPAGELRLTSTRATPRGNGDRTVLRYTRSWKGAPVDGDEVSLISTNGRIGAAWVRLTPIRGLPSPVAGERIVADPTRGFGRLVRLRRAATAVRAVERDGTEVYAYDPRHFDTVTVTHEELTVDDPLVTHPARDVRVTDASGLTEQTADDGSHSLTGSLAVTVSGPTLEVLQNGATITHDGTDDIDLDGGDDISWSAASTLHHSHAVRDWLELRWPTHSWLSSQWLADVDLTSGSCNAYYTNGTINFYKESGSCNATGRIASVIYHEVGHGIHEYILAAGSFASDVSEGSSDFVSATLLDDADISRGFYTDGSGIRELETDKFYPADVTGEVHQDGLIWGSFLWNLREQWIDSMGEELGVEETDLLFLGALEQGPGLTDLGDAVLVADDDDGDWSNGTPHDCELIDLLDYHGLGPGPLGVLTVEQGPLGPQASTTEAYPISVVTRQNFTHCTGALPPTASAWYTTSGEARLPAPDGTGWEAWTELPLTSTDGETWTGDLPRQAVPAFYRYFTVVTSADGTTSEASHGELEQGVWSFWIGDRAPLWCEDFESGGPGLSHGASIPWESAIGTTDEWVIGSPIGTAGRDPDMAASGASILTTGLDADYLPNNAEHLLTPATGITTEGRMRLLTYQRWLSVEDGLYDRAQVVVTDGTTTMPIWANAGTVAGTTALIDTDWTTTDHDLTGFLTPEGFTAAPLSFGFSLRTDAGLEYGGWSLDDVCIVELDDPPDHYRRVDLVGAWADADEAEVGTVELAWHTPWIRPLGGTVLVRQADRAPESLTDGVIVHLDLSPQFGEEHAISDSLPGLERGTSWTYALFAWGAGDDDTYTTAVDGQNALTFAFPLRDTGSPPDTAEDTAVATDTADSADTGAGPEPEDTGREQPEPECGCNAPGGAGAQAGGLVNLLAAALAYGGRRRSTAWTPTGTSSGRWPTT
jgi:hypothetical protein